MRNLSSLLLLLTAGASPALAQSLYNSGSTITLANGATLYTTSDLTNTSGGTITTNGSAVRVDGNLTNAGSYSLGTAGTLEVQGNLTNAAAATFNGGTGTVTLAGTAGAQTLDVNAATLPNLTVNNTSASSPAVNVASDASISGTLLLTSGTVNTRPGGAGTTVNTISLLDGAVVSGETSSRYVQGRLSETRSNVNSSGTTTFSSGVAVTPNATLGALTIARTAGLQTAQVSYGTNAAGTTQGIDRIWQFSTAPGAAASLTFSWLADDDNGNASAASYRAWARTAAPVAGSDWTGVGSYQAATVSGTNRSFTTPGGDFTYWTVSSLANPLPVELVRFAAARVGEAARLDWVTASEKDNDHWDVQVSVDGREFRTFATVAGHGSTATQSTYTLTDPALLRYRAAVVYYRLRQVDGSGQGSFSPVQAVRVEAGTDFVARAFPSPIGPDGTTLELQTNLSGPAQLTVYDAMGRQVASLSTDLLAGSNQLALPATGRLAAGVYFLHVRQGQQHTTLKLTRE